jgi:hypothetical protein
MLFAMRGLSSASSREHTPRPVVTTVERIGFIRLREDPPHEIVIGVVGRFWTPKGDLRSIEPEAFASFEEPGYAKAAWNFSISPAGDGTVRVSTETRVQGLDAASRRKFRLYWMVVGPFSGVIRKEMLREIRGRAEAALV